MWQSKLRNLKATCVVVTWAGGICLICMPEAREHTLSGKPRLPMLQVICITYGTLKSAQTKLKPTITLISCAYIKNARFTYVS